MKIKRKATNVVIYVFVTLVSLSAIVPLLYVLLTSLKTSGQIYDVNQIVPTSFTLENYINVLYKAKFLTYFRNSVIVAVCTTVVCMVLSICAGYGMTRYRVRGSQKLKWAFCIPGCSPPCCWPCLTMSSCGTWIWAILCWDLS